MRTLLPGLEEVVFPQRMHGESDPAWEAFLIYRDMGTERRLKKVAEKCGKNNRLIARWSTEHHWRARAWQHDCELDAVRIKTHKDSIADMSKRHADLAAQMLEKAAKRLESLDAAELSSRDIAQILRVAVEIERNSRGADHILIPRRGLKPPPEETSFIDLFG